MIQRSLHPTAAAITIASLLCSCILPADLDDGNSEASSSSSDDSDGASSSDDGMTSSSATTTADDGSESGTSSPEETCAAYCVYESACWDGGDPDCVDACLFNLAVYDELDAGCDAAMEQHTSCIAAAPQCDDSACAVPTLAVGACESLYGCSIGTMGAIEGPGCQWEMACGYLEETRRIHCDDVTCTCLLDGEAVGSCDTPDAVCNGDEGAATECCGWTDAFGDPV